MDPHQAYAPPSYPQVQYQAPTSSQHRYAYGNSLPPNAHSIQDGPYLSNPYAVAAPTSSYGGGASMYDSQQQQQQIQMQMLQQMYQNNRGMPMPMYQNPSMLNPRSSMNEGTNNMTMNHTTMSHLGMNHPHMTMNNSMGIMPTAQHYSYSLGQRGSSTAPAAMPMSDNIYDQSIAARQFNRQNNSGPITNGLAVSTQQQFYLPNPSLVPDAQTSPRAASFEKQSSREATGGSNSNLKVDAGTNSGTSAKRAGRPTSNIWSVFTNATEPWKLKECDCR